MLEGWCAWRAGGGAGLCRRPPVDERELQDAEMWERIAILTCVAATGYAATAGTEPYFEEMQRFFVGFFEWFGDLTLFEARLIRSGLAPPYEVREFLHQLDELGAKSLPLVILAGAATGVVVTLSTRDSLVRFGAKGFLPAVVVFSIIKE